ncbi:unnamed protein product [Protopolystoma xenopodis]|uniref:Uncharacterized protein n=1 Tax=Protopolystoma xenopodis TaxID=117903 RepID=A0A448X224_9PLAT|nr:unnamed protein product [Protopolystoma xenopodis]
MHSLQPRIDQPIRCSSSPKTDDTFLPTRLCQGGLMSEEKDKKTNEKREQEEWEEDEDRRSSCGRGCPSSSRAGRLSVPASTGLRDLMMTRLLPSGLLDHTVSDLSTHHLADKIRVGQPISQTAEQPTTRADQ